MKKLSPESADFLDEGITDAAEDEMDLISEAPDDGEMPGADPFSENTSGIDSPGISEIRLDRERRDEEEQ